MITIVVPATVRILLDAYTITENDRQRFSQRLIRVGDCLVWRGGAGAGYGKFRCGPHNVGAHIFAFYSANYGHLPAPKQGQIHVAHSCRNPPCCNPEHLSLATRPVNLAERTYPGEIANTKAEWDQLVTLIRSNSKAGTDVGQ